jgi:hypothetical protein
MKEFHNSLDVPDLIRDTQGIPEMTSSEGKQVYTIHETWLESTLGVRTTLSRLVNLKNKNHPLLNRFPTQIER